MKKIASLTWAFVLGLGLVFGIVLLLDRITLVSADPNVLYVAPGGLCDGATPCYSSVQQAVDAASSGDQIKIAVGQYAGVESRSGMSQTVYISKTLTIGGGYTVTDWSRVESATTILDAQSQGRVACVTGSVTVTLENLVLTGGSATTAGGANVGGGIYVNGANLLVVQSVISNNVAGSGGAVYAIGASVTLTANQVVSNVGGLGFNQCQVTLFGNHVYSNTHSGLVLSNGTIAMLDANNISKNASDNYGAGIFIDHSVVTITRNVVSENASPLDGSGFMISQSAATIEGNRIFSNTTQNVGGGLMSFESVITLTANVIMANRAIQDGGGVFLSNSDATLVNNVIAQNQAVQGSAVFVQNSSPVCMVHNTIAQNGGGGQGMYVLGSPADPSTVALTNTIMVSQSVGIANLNGTVDANGVLWYGNGANYTGAVTVSNEITGSPDFVLPMAGDYRPGKVSAAINAGIDAGTLTDISGQLRDAYPDLGAHEARLVDISLTKAVSPVAALPGEVITFTLTFSNDSRITATHLIMTDHIPAFLSVISILSHGVAITDTGHISPYVWAVQDLPPGASGIITLTGQLAIPLTDGTYINTATMTADDDAWIENNTATAAIVVPNVSPAWTSVPPTTATQDTLYAYAAVTEDLNGSDALTITAPTLPVWLTLADHADGTATLSGTPGNAYVGDHAVVLRVTDSGGLTATQSFTITVANVNDAPTFASASVTTATQDTPYSYAVTTADPDLPWGDALTITAPTLPVWLTLADHADGTAILSGTPGNVHVGDHAVLLRVADSGGLTATQTFTVTVARAEYWIYLPLAMK